MKNLLIILFVSLGLNAMSQEKTSGAYDIAGTTWYKEIKGADLDDQRITFLYNGAIFEENDENSPFLDHYWKQKGNKIIISYNSEYAIYKGKMKGDTIKGKAKNIKGKKWTFTMTRVYNDKQS